MPRTTNLDYAILGLLEQEAKTGYAIRQVFEQTALGNYSSSPGSIYPALKKLEKAKFIEKCLRLGEKKRQFELTAKGRDQLLEWLNAPFPEEDISKHLGEVLLKFAFMENLLPLDKRLAFLADLAERIEKSLDWLTTIHRDYSHTMSLHSKLAMENGIEGQKAHLRWAKHAHKTLRESQD